MLSGAAFFSVMAAIAHALGSHIDWQVVAIARSGMALVFAGALAWAAGATLVLRGPPILWMRSLAGSVSMVCTFYALSRLPVSDVLTVTNMFPIWVALLSWPLLGEVPRLPVWLAVACAAAGIFLIQQPHLDHDAFALLIAAGGSLFTALAMLGLHKVRGIDHRAIVVHFSAVALVFCVAALFLFDRQVPLENTFDVRALLMLLGIGVTATIGQLFLTKAFAAGAPTKVAVVGLTQIVFALGLDVLLLDYQVTWTSLGGMALVVAPTACLMVQRGPADPDEPIAIAGTSELEMSGACDPS
jgi:drug/metabolite transporter (DMT)-like permease